MRKTPNTTGGSQAEQDSPRERPSAASAPSTSCVCNSRTHSSATPSSSAPCASRWPCLRPPRVRRPTPAQGRAVGGRIPGSQPAAIARRRRRARDARIEAHSGPVPTRPIAGMHQHRLRGAPYGIHRRTALPERLFNRAVHRGRDGRRGAPGCPRSAPTLIGIHITAPADERRGPRGASPRDGEVRRPPQPGAAPPLAPPPLAPGGRAATPPRAGPSALRPPSPGRRPAGRRPRRTARGAGFAITNSRPAGTTSAPPASTRSVASSNPRLGRACEHDEDLLAIERVRRRGAAGIQAQPPGARLGRPSARRREADRHGCPRRRSGGAAESVMTGMERSFSLGVCPRQIVHFGE